MLFRIGVNLGDVIEEGDRIYGDGVNIAARLEGLAEPGGVCISGSAHEQIKNKLALGYEYIGEHSVKNITEPLKVYKVPMGPKAVTPKEEKEKKAGSKTWQRVAFPVVAIIILGAVAIWYFSFRQAPVVRDVEEAPKTIAVLPFDDLSPEKDQEYFVLGLSEEILNYLSKISGLHVTSRTSSFTFKDSDKTIQEIAEILGREYILEGSVRKAGNELRITAQLIQVADDRHLWSETYDRELKDIFAVQEDIAIAVADELKVTLGIGKSLKQLGGTDNENAYELYLVARGQLGNIDYSSTIETIDAALDLDSGFALAWNLKTRAYIQGSFFTETKGLSSELIDAAFNAAKRAIEIEPNLGTGYISSGHLKLIHNDFVEAELYFRRSMELLKESLSGDEDYIIAHYHAVGNFKRARELIDQIRRYDPLHIGYSGYYIFNMGYIGDIPRAEDEYERRKAAFGDNLWLKFCITAVRIGSGNAVTNDKVANSDPIYDAAIVHIDSPEDGLEELCRIYSDHDNLSIYNLVNISIWAAYFGDVEFAMDVIEDISTGFWIWLPVFQEVRQLPRFKEFVREIGLVDYWNKFGWPDICRRLDNGDFECD
jgi:TolB-like protein